MRIEKVYLEKGGFYWFSVDSMIVGLKRYVFWVWFGLGVSNKCFCFLDIIVYYKRIRKLEYKF